MKISLEVDSSKETLKVVHTIQCYLYLTDLKDNVSKNYISVPFLIEAKKISKRDFSGCSMSWILN